MKPTLSSRASRATQLLTGSLLAFGIAYACGSEEADAPFDPNRQKVLASSGSCALSMSEDFLDQAQKLVDAVENWKGDPTDDEALNGARDAWTEAMLSWQTAEGTQFGPAGSSSSPDKGGTVGGRDLRDRIYSWTLVNSCRVDEGLVETIYENSLVEEPVNVRGLDAVEYLLFYQEPESTCAASNQLVTDGTWDDIDDLLDRRASYALAAARDVLDSAQELVQAWEKDGGDFLASLENAGQSGPYGSQSDAFNEVLTGLVHVDTHVKDLKLGTPLGLQTTCTDPCPEQFEHQWSGISKDSIAFNLMGFDKLYTGCAKGAYGFDDLLIEKGGEGVVEDIEAARAKIDEALEDISENDLRDAFSDDEASLLALYDRVKALTDILKNEFVTTLDAEIRAVGGDND